MSINNRWGPTAPVQHDGGSGSNFPRGDSHGVVASSTQTGTQFDPQRGMGATNRGIHGEAGTFANGETYDTIPVSTLVGGGTGSLPPGLPPNMQTQQHWDMQAATAPHLQFAVQHQQHLPAQPQQYAAGAVLQQQQQQQQLYHPFASPTAHPTSNGHAQNPSQPQIGTLQHHPFGVSDASLGRGRSRTLPHWMTTAYGGVAAPATHMPPPPPPPSYPHQPVQYSDLHAPSPDPFQTQFAHPPPPPPTTTQTSDEPDTASIYDPNKHTQRYPMDSATDFSSVSTAPPLQSTLVPPSEASTTNSTSSSVYQTNTQETTGSTTNPKLNKKVRKRKREDNNPPTRSFGTAYTGQRQPAVDTTAAATCYAETVEQQLTNALLAMETKVARTAKVPLHPKTESETKQSDDVVLTKKVANRIQNDLGGLDLLILFHKLKRFPDSSIELRTMIQEHGSFSPRLRVMAEAGNTRFFGSIGGLMMEFFHVGNLCSRSYKGRKFYAWNPQWVDQILFYETIPHPDEAPPILRQIAEACLRRFAVHSPRPGTTAALMEYLRDNLPSECNTAIMEELGSVEDVSQQVVESVFRKERFLLNEDSDPNKLQWNMALLKEMFPPASGFVPLATSVAASQFVRFGLLSGAFPAHRIQFQRIFESTTHPSVHGLGGDGCFGEVEILRVFVKTRCLEVAPNGVFIWDHEQLRTSFPGEHSALSSAIAAKAPDLDSEGEVDIISDPNADTNNPLATSLADNDTIVQPKVSSSQIEPPKDPVALKQMKLEAQLQLKQAMLLKKKALKERLRQKQRQQTEPQTQRPINALLKGGLSCLSFCDINSSGPEDKVRFLTRQLVEEEASDNNSADSDGEEAESLAPESVDCTDADVIETVDTSGEQQDQTRDELIQRRKDADRKRWVSKFNNFVSQQEQLLLGEETKGKETAEQLRSCEADLDTEERKLADARLSSESLLIRKDVLDSLLAEEVADLLSKRSKLHELENRAT